MIKFENKDNGRFYYIQMDRDILNDVVITVIRGGVNSTVFRRYGYGCEAIAVCEIERLCKRRIARGYTTVQ